MDESDGVTAAWWMIGITIAFKVGLSLWVLIAYPSAQNLIMQIALNWPWLLAIVVLVASPAVFWARMVRVRAKRAKLQRAEWNVDTEFEQWYSKP